MPKRIQLQRKKGWRKPEGAIVVARPSRWGNPYTVRSTDMGEWMVYEYDEVVSTLTGSHTDALAQCLAFYGLWAELQIACQPDWLDPLRGHDLCCWCKEDERCHADVLLEMAAQEE